MNTTTPTANISVRLHELTNNQPDIPHQEYTVYKPRPDGTLNVIQMFPEETMTKQSFKDECDINHIMKNFQKTGILPNQEKQFTGKYGDFADPIAFHDAMNLVIHAEDQFNALSADLRDRFHNDPQRFLEYTSNPANNEEMVKLGLATASPLETLPQVDQTPIPTHKPQGSKPKPKVEDTE